MTDISAAYVRERFELHPDGYLIWQPCDAKSKMWNAKYAGRRAGGLNNANYYSVCIDGTRYLVHRVIFLFVHGWLPTEVDHVNMERGDNRVSNLRAATSSTNKMNRPRQSNNKSGCKGVHWHPATRKWRARIKAMGKHHSLGLFATLEDANSAYKNAARRLHGDFAR